MQGLHQRPSPHCAIAGRRVDVLIPVYNCAATVASAIDSIRAQTAGNLRIIVVDDGSSDDTPRILADLAASDPRIFVVTIAHCGIVDALNQGLEHCTAEFIARHDADDIAYAHRFAVQLEYLQAHPDCIAVSSFARQVNKDGMPNGGLSIFPSPDSSDPTWIPCKEPYLLHPFLMVRRCALLAVGGYRYVHLAEDADLCWRLQDLGRLHIIPKLLGDYRLHAQSITGLSPLNGRLSAINSQLAAVSALRRRSNANDLQFTKLAIDSMYASVTAAAIFDVGRRDLSSTETSYLKAAFAAKFLELASYRPYELELDDCHFIRAALLPAELQLTAHNRTAIRRLRAKLCARLLIKGRLRAALALLSLHTFTETGVRFCVHVAARCVPRGVRAAFWSWRARYRATGLH